MKKVTAVKGKRRLGRPRCPIETARRNRVVTMVTDAELQKLTEIAGEDNRSVSAVVHSVLTRFLNRKN